MPISTLGENIRRWRKTQGLSQKDVVLALGQEQVNLSQYEHNARVPSLKNLARLAMALQVSILDLLEGTEYLERK